MKFDIGDRVGFLDENLEGSVIRLLDNSVCRVEVEGGLSFDVHASKLVLIRKASVPGIPTSTAMAEKAARPQPETAKPFAPLEEEVFYFLSVPAEDMQVLTGPVRFYLVNKLPYRVYYGFSAKIGQRQQGIAAGMLASGEEVMLCERNRDELLDWQHMNLQALFYRDNAFDMLPPLNKELPMQLPDLKVAHAKLSGHLRYSRVTSLTTSSVKPPDLTALRELFSVKPAGDKPARKPARKPPADDGAVLVNETEVDLHIQHLVDDYKDLGNSEMLQIQMKRFRQEMDKALRDHYKKVIFIHGVGNGRLRTEILRELRGYSGVVYHDASFQKYGYGATEVVFI